MLDYEYKGPDVPRGPTPGAVIVVILGVPLIFFSVATNLETILYGIAFDAGVTGAAMLVADMFGALGCALMLLRWNKLGRVLRLVAMISATAYVAAFVGAWISVRIHR